MIYGRDVASNFTSSSANCECGFIQSPKSAKDEHEKENMFQSSWSDAMSKTKKKLVNNILEGERGKFLCTSYRTVQSAI